MSFLLGLILFVVASAATALLLGTFRTAADVAGHGHDHGHGHGHGHDDHGHGH